MGDTGGRLALLATEKNDKREGKIYLVSSQRIFLSIIFALPIIALVAMHILLGKFSTTYAHVFSFPSLSFKTASTVSGVVSSRLSGGQTEKQQQQLDT